MYILRISNQNDVSLLYIMLEIHHSAQEPSNFYVRSLVCPGSQPAVYLAWQKIKYWTFHANFATKLFHTSHTSRHHCLLPFYTTFTDLDLGWVSQGQHNAKPLAFIFLHFYLIRVSLIWCWSNSRWISWYHFWVKFNDIMEITDALLCEKKSWKIGIHSDIYEHICF